jgi:hypothetical protein
MRCFPAPLALAGALVVFSSGASVDGRSLKDDRYQVAQGADARDVTRAKRCPPPFSCRKKEQKRAPGVAMFSMIDVAAAAEGILARIHAAMR